MNPSSPSYSQRAPPKTRGTLLYPLISILLSLLVFSCFGADSPPQLPLAVPSPRASPPSLDLTQADNLRHDGRLEEAIAIYGAVAQAKKGEPQRQALWGLAQAYLLLQQYPETVQVLQAFLDRQPNPEAARRARYLLGLALAETGLNEEAAAAFRAYIESGGPAQPYARIQLANLLAEAGRHGEAAVELAPVLTTDLPPQVGIPALIALGKAYAAAGDINNALLAYQRALEVRTSAADKASALWERAALFRANGDEATRLANLSQIVRDYPSDLHALDALAELDLAGVPASLLEKAIVFFEHRRNGEAETAFLEVLASQPSADVAGQSRYHLGILGERRGDPEGALAQYEAALAVDPNGPLAADAAWWRAQLLEFSDRPDEAAAAYAALADAYPQSARAADAVFRAGFVRYRQGGYADAMLFWERHRSVTARPFQLARASYWLGRAASALGDEGFARTHFQQAMQSAPLDYYAFRAQATLAGQESLGDDDLSSPPAPPSWPEIESWLTLWVGPETSGTTEALLAMPGWQRGEELALAGLSQSAAREFNTLLTDISASPWLVYRLVRSLYDLGDIPSLTWVAGQLARAHEGAPRSLLTTAYPLDFLPIIVEEGEREGVSPLLLLALIRQESLFDPQARSPAGALGLAQIIPSTAQAIAQELRVSDFEEVDLLRPTLSIRFGTHYLASQLRYFDGDLLAALAAYNGGPGNALRWRELAPDDPDLFVEIIDLSETSIYVQIVLENYALYRYLFNLTETPSLALP